MTEEALGKAEDIITLILEEHARLRHLFAELQEGERRSSPAALWAELAALLRRHLQAAEEISYLPFLYGAADERPVIRHLRADKDDIFDAVADAGLREAESVPWWLAVRAARAAAERHVDCVESGLLPRARQQLSADRRRVLGHQWRQFTVTPAANGAPHPTAEALDLAGTSMIVGARDPQAPTGPGARAHEGQARRRVEALDGMFALASWRRCCWTRSPSSMVGWTAQIVQAITAVPANWGVEADGEQIRDAFEALGTVTTVRAGPARSSR